MSLYLHVAIDGPVASGKTTVARLLARDLDVLYLDTGAMYRAVAFIALQHGIDLDNEALLLELLRENAVHIEADAHEERGYRIFAGTHRLGDELFTNEVAAVVSTVAAHPAIRDELTRQQRAIARRGPVVMAGRDIGTVVLPDAPVKIFLTASTAARVERRLSEFASYGHHLDRAHLAEQIEERDRVDRSRLVAPLRAAPDAITIDSSDLTPEEVVARIRTEVDRIQREYAGRP